MTISTFRAWCAQFSKGSEGAVTVDWVVLSALAVTLLSAGYGSLRSGTTELAGGTSTYMATYLD